MSARGYFVAGTDTGVGKTLLSCALLAQAREGGFHAVGMKPVAAGCQQTLAGARNDDALALLAHSSDSHLLAYDDINPYALMDAVSPQLAAQREGVTIDPDRICVAYRRLAARAEVVIVEGAGGWLAPISDTATMADIARRLALPVILVVGVRLGCLNLAQLTARAIVADGCTLAGWLGSVIAPGMEAIDANVSTLRDRLPTPCLGVLQWSPDANPDVVCKHLRLPAR